MAAPWPGRWANSQSGATRAGHCQGRGPQLRWLSGLGAGGGLPRWCWHGLAGERSPPHGLPLAGADCRGRGQPSCRALGRSSWRRLLLITHKHHKPLAPLALRSVLSISIAFSPSCLFSPQSLLQSLPLPQRQPPRHQAPPAPCSAPVPSGSWGARPRSSPPPSPSWLSSWKLMIPSSALWHSQSWRQPCWQKRAIKLPSPPKQMPPAG